MEDDLNGLKLLEKRKTRLIYYYVTSNQVDLGHLLELCPYFACILNGPCSENKNHPLSTTPFYNKNIILFIFFSVNLFLSLTNTSKSFYRFWLRTALSLTYVFQFIKSINVIFVIPVPPPLHIFNSEFKFQLTWLVYIVHLHSAMHEADLSTSKNDI